MASHIHFNEHVRLIVQRYGVTFNAFLRSIVYLIIINIEFVHFWIKHQLKFGPNENFRLMKVNMVFDTVFPVMNKMRT